MRFLVFIVCVVILVAIFSTQNSQPVSVSLFIWKFQASLAIVVFLSLLSGVVVGVLASFFIRLSKRRKGGGTREPESIDSDSLFAKNHSHKRG